ncbi:hypothetical protein B0H11DRAFT_2386798 [Mycena galericulata]|nr:hypothetical protein B0H11DRAFT_2386798 [Mycena galericulata]
MRLCLPRLPHLPPTLELLLEAHGAAYCPQATWVASLLLLVHAALALLLPALLPRTPAPLPRLHDGPLSLAGVHPSPATRSPPMRRSNYGPRAQVGDVAPLFIPAAHPLYSRSGNPVTLQMGARVRYTSFRSWAYKRAEGFARMRKLTDARTLIAASTMAKEQQIDGEENGVEGVEDKIVNQDENGRASVKKSLDLRNNAARGPSTRTNPGITGEESPQGLRKDITHSSEPGFQRLGGGTGEMGRFGPTFLDCARQENVHGRRSGTLGRHTDRPF